MADDLATVLSLERANEEKWQPQAMDNETRVLTPLTAETPMPDSFKSMPLPRRETSGRITRSRRNNARCKD